MYLAMDILVSSRIMLESYETSSPFRIGESIDETVSGWPLYPLLILKSLLFPLDYAKNSFYFCKY
jgi:hypothetical protein